MKLKTPILLLILIALFTACTKESTISQEFPYDNSKYVEVDGVTLHYRVWQNSSGNENPWILLVHGFSGSTYTWNKNVDTLVSSGYNVVAVDVPPFGYSDKSTKINHSVDNRARLLWSFTNTVSKEEKWILFGHSMGGGIVAAMAIQEPQKIYKIVLVAPSLFGEVKPGRSTRQKLLSFAPVEFIVSSFGRIFLVRKKRVEKLVESAYGKPGTDEDVMAYYIPLKQKGMARAIISASSRAKPSTTLNIADFNSEALAIWGENDTWVPFSRMKRITDLMENLSIVIIKDTGHNPMETDSKLFNKIVLEYLSQP